MPRSHRRSSSNRDGSRHSKERRKRSPSERRGENNPKMPQWLKESFDKVGMTNVKCEDFLAEVNGRLSQKILGEFDNGAKQQALFELLGEKKEQKRPSSPAKPAFLLQSPKVLFRDRATGRERPKRHNHCSRDCQHLSKASPFSIGLVTRPLYVRVPGLLAKIELR